jgi:hypothetical protein
MAGSMSTLARTGTKIACTRRDAAAASIERMKNLDCGDVSGLNMTYYTQSIRMLRQLLAGRMFPLTLDGLDAAMRELVR